MAVTTTTKPGYSEEPSTEYRAIKKNYRRLLDAVSRGQIPAVLLEEEIVDDDVVGLPGSLTSKEKGEKIMQQVLQSIKLRPQFFESFCKALEAEPVVEDVLAKLKDTHKTLIQEQRSVISSEPQVTEEFQKLKDQLTALSSIKQSASSPHAEVSAINCFQDLIQQYIEKALRSGIETSQVKNDMEKLCRVHLVIPAVLWTWTMQEVDKANEKLTSELRKVVKPKVKEGTPKPSLFSKDTLYHASLCCDAINVSTSLAKPQSYFQNKNPQHNFTEVSFSQSRDSITPYLIAKLHDVIYVAFQSTPFLDKWMENATSFNEGLRQQSSQIPLRFFMEELYQDRKIVLTGFSFGGMLACCVGAQLWRSTTDREILLQRVVCITFGQPFLQIKMVQDEIDICPQFEQSIHSVFSKDDVVPLMFSYLHVDESNLPNVSSPLSSTTKALVGPSDCKRGSTRSQPRMDGLFSVPFVKTFLQNLAILQEHSLQQAKKYSEAHLLRPLLHERVSAAIEGLSMALQSLAIYQDQNTSILYGNCYVMSKGKEGGITWQHQAKQLAAIELSQRTKLVASQLDETLFHEFTMESYKRLIFRSYLEKPEKYVLPYQRQAVKEVAEVDALKPKITGVEVLKFANEHVIVLQGENLWFSYKISFEKKSDHDHVQHCEINIPAKNTTKCLIEFHFTDSDDASSFLHESHESKPVKIALCTHFANPIRQPLNTTKEPHVFSVRQIQLAKQTPTQIIQLAYLCALLEQRDQKAESKRFKAVAYFLEEAVKVVPLESVFDAITYEKHEIALECAKALRERKLQLQPSQQMIMGALKAAIRARTGYHGSIIDRLYVPSVKSTEQILQSVIRWGLTIQQLQQVQNPRPLQQFQVVIQSEVRQQPRPQAKSQGRQQTRPHGRTQPQSQTKALCQSSQKPKKRAQGETKLSYSDALATSSSSSGGQFGSYPQQIPQSLQVTLPFPISIFLGHSQYPSPIPFPRHITIYLQECLDALFQQKTTQESLRFGTELGVVSKTNISEVYSVSSERRSAHFKSPLQVLRDAMKSIATYTEETEMSQTSGTKMHNEQMLKLIERIFNHDVAVCASLLGAFMEQQIRIPLLNTAKDTAETLSSKAAPVAVGVWALFSLNLHNLQQMLSSSNRSELVVEIKEYIEGIRQQLPENEDRMYAGKLQFLLQGIKEIVTAGNQYISYSLEHQLCSNLKFEKVITLRKLITQWDVIFKDDALSLIAESHRPLVARWLKWTILVHDLREALAQYTCIGVTGLVNSGKSLLVKKLFGIEKVKVGTRAAKRTTVPLLYNLEENIDGLDVIDFPGVDDSDHNVPELADLLLSLAQIVVFVVDYRKASSDPVKSWLKALIKNGAPVLVCLTHADVLYLECTEENRQEDIVKELVHFQKHLKVHTHHSPEVSFYSFKQTSDVKTSAEDLKKFGIKSPVDVGEWLVRILKTRFRLDELADKLKEFIQTD